jgi:tRNA(Ile)-lysidine synthase
MTSKSNWPAKAARVGAAVPRSSLHPAVLAWADRDRQAGPWAVALSGGADSLALLLAMWSHWPDRRQRLVVLHFNHRLRGRASDADATFCRTVGRKLGLKCVVGVWPGAHAGASEADAREARLKFFVRVMKKLKARALWLAHQQDDIAESMLMRLARGSGTGGLAAPRPVHPTGDGRVHLRPLLTVSKAELVAALRGAGAAWREDATNGRDDFLRNRLRRSVVPAWVRAAGRDARAGAALARERLEEDDAALETWLDKLRPLRGGVLNLRILEAAPAALWRRALHRWLLAVRPETDLSRRGFDQLLATIRRGIDTRFSLGTNGFARVRGGRLAWQGRRIRTASRRRLPRASF